MAEKTRECKYREALEKTRNRLDYLEEQYADKEIYSEFDELLGFVEEGLKANNLVSTDKLSVEKLQEQLNTARYFFKNILDVNPNLKKGSYAHLSNCVDVMKISAEKALAEIGNEGSGDE